MSQINDKLSQINDGRGKGGGAGEQEEEADGGGGGGGGYRMENWKYRASAVGF